MTGPDPRIAVTVIGGYLGSGKTTLVNHILANATERIAVLVNDFGDINIDLDLIQSRDENTIELSNGCICCSLVEGFGVALDQVLALDPRPARLVVEASGVSDPAQVAAYAHGPGLELDATIVLVDAETIRTQIDDRYVGQTVRGQLASADVLVVNKADLVDAADLLAVSEWAGEQCPDAVVATAANAAVPAELLFGVERVVATSDAAPHIHAEDVFTSWTYEQTDPMPRAKVEQWVESLADTVVRAKGLVWLDESDEDSFVLQRVGRRWSLRRGAQWSGEPATRVVVIETVEA